MNQKHIYFKINQTAEIRFDLSDQVKDAFRYDEISVILNCKNNFEIQLYQDFLITSLREFESSLLLALSGKAILHSSINANIGYLWNQYLHDDELPVENDREGYAFWVGRKYLIWSCAPSNTATWLYEKNGKFWFEITPDYPWHFLDPKEGENFVTYEQFMKSYEPIALFEVSRETLEKWLKRVNELIPIVEANDSKYFIQKK